MAVALRDQASNIATLQGCNVAYKGEAPLRDVLATRRPSWVPPDRLLLRQGDVTTTSQLRRNPVSSADDRRRLTVRLPERLADHLEKAAAADRRSVNGYLTVLLEQALPSIPEQSTLDVDLSRTA